MSCLLLSWPSSPLQRSRPPVVVVVDQQWLAGEGPPFWPRADGHLTNVKKVPFWHKTYASDSKPAEIRTLCLERQDCKRTSTSTITNVLFRSILRSFSRSSGSPSQPWTHKDPSAVLHNITELCWVSWTRGWRFGNETENLNDLVSVSWCTTARIMFPYSSRRIW